MKGKFETPLWVECVYRVLEWMDYKIVSRISSKLMWWRNGLLDRHCRCKRCEERKRTGAA